MGVIIVVIFLWIIYFGLPLILLSLRDYYHAQREARQREIAQHSVTVEVD